jgi:predicted DsbA family dithiol-disulfide isomerase
LKELAQTHSVTIAWHSFELRPAGSPPIPPAYRARIEAGRPQLAQIARERGGVELSQGPFGQNSRPALIGAKFAEAHGAGEAYHDAVFRAYWLEARAIETPDDLAPIAAAAGLDTQAFRAALDDPQYLALVDEDIELARQYGLSGVPAIVFEQRYLLSGAQPTALLRQVCDRLLEESSE